MSERIVAHLDLFSVNGRAGAGAARPAAHHHDAGARDHHRRLTRRALVAVAAGLIVALSLPPWGWWPLSFVGIALFQWGVTSHGYTPSRRASFALGFLFALAWLATGTAWMWQLSAPGYIAANVVYAAWHGVAELTVPARRRADDDRAVRWSVVIRPLAHTLVEALRFSFPFGGVPLASLGIAQAAGPFAAPARVGGVILITWVVLQLGVALGALVESRRVTRGSPGRTALARRRGAARRHRHRASSLRVATTPANTSRSPPCRAAASRARAPSTCPADW